jgi:DNA-binding response OmpR family regulator
MSQQNRILCVDDDKDTIDLLKTMFKYKHCLVSSAMTSEQGLRYATRGNFDAIILDYKLPDGMGTELCREIRQHDSETPIIFFSASAFEGDYKAGLSAGADAYLLKPEDVFRISDVVMEFIESRKHEPIGVGASLKGCF